jgi:hypothetical protein
MSAGEAARPGDVPLTGGRMTSGIVRRGDLLLRPMGPWSAAVHEYLRHLEAAGFRGSPRVLGTDGDREVLTFLPGDVANDPSWQPGHGHRLPPYAGTDMALRAAAVLLRELHSASAGFEPAHTGYRFRPRPPRAGKIISHGDIGPWNTVYRDGQPAALIDWDGAQPVDPLIELAEAAWAFVPLAPAQQLAEAGFDPLPDLPARLRTFVDAYGLADRATILPALRQCKQPDPERLADWPADAGGGTSAVDAQALRWLQAIAADLAAAL